MPKVTIPSPTMLHFRGGRAAISKEAYPDLDNFFADVAAAYREEIKQLGDAGCRYIQLDDTNLAYLCDEKMREGARQRGENPDDLPKHYAQFINEAIRDVITSYSIHYTKLYDGRHPERARVEGRGGAVPAHVEDLPHAHERQRHTEGSGP